MVEALADPHARRPATWREPGGRARMRWLVLRRALHDERELAEDVAPHREGALDPLELPGAAGEVALAAGDGALERRREDVGDRAALEPPAALRLRWRGLRMAPTA